MANAVMKKVDVDFALGRSSSRCSIEGCIELFEGCLERVMEIFWFVHWVGKDGVVIERIGMLECPFRPDWGTGRFDNVIFLGNFYEHLLVIVLEKKYNVVWRETDLVLVVVELVGG